MLDKDGDSTRLEMAHVLFMDLVGYSRLSVEEQSRRVDALQEIVRLRPTYRHAESEGALLAHPAGDGMALAFFGDPSSPAQCALEVAEAVVGRSDLPLRMGIHTGTVHRAEDINRAANVRGPGINLAQRVMDCGDPGHILLSYTAAEALTDSETWAPRLSDLGEATVKHGVTIRLYSLTDGDLGNRERPARLGEREVAGAAAPGRHNLPSALTSLIGREDEVEQIKERLSSSRLVTLTGTGGAGKTRLSMRVGEDMLAEFPDGVWFVELASVSDPELIPVAVAAVLDVQDSPEQTLLTTLVRYLDGQQALIILDNCEHLVDAAAALARDLLQRCGALRILATSREILGVNGEATWRVRSLSVPGAEQDQGSADVGNFEAVRLFVSRAQAARADFTLTDENAPIVSAICRRVDGIPLALELAAARVRAMSVEQIHARLDERFRLLTGGGRASPRRQQTLAALVDWSFRLLDEDQQALFCRLAVFVGGFTAEAAESVGAHGDVDAWDVPDLLMQLVDKSLVVVEEGVAGSRYRMLETLREYGLDRGVESGEADDARSRHAEYLATWVGGLADDCHGPREVETLDRIEEDHDNIRQSLQWLLDGDPRAACAVMHDLQAFWSDRGHHTEAQAWRTRAIDGSEGADSVEVSLVRMGRALTAMHTDRVEQARPDAEAAAKGLREADHPVGMAYGEFLLGVVALTSGRSADATERFDRAMTLFRGVGTAAQVASAMQTHAWVVHRSGDIAQAWTLAGGALAACIASGHLAGEGMCVLLQGVIRMEQGRHADARGYLGRAWELHVQVKNQDHQAYNLFHQARLAIEEGDYVSAYSYSNAYVPLVRRLGRPQAVCWTLGHCGSAAAASGRHATAVDHYLAALAVKDANPLILPRIRLGLFDSLFVQGDVAGAREQLTLAIEPAYDGETMDTQARCVQAYARLAEHAGDYKLAARLLASALAWRGAQPDLPVWWGDRSKFWRYEWGLAEEARARVDAALSAEAFAAAWAAGESMALAEARSLAESALAGADAG